MKKDLFKILQIILTFLGITVVIGINGYLYGISAFLVITYLLLILITYFYYFKNEKFEKAFNKIIDYRYIVALLVFIILVAFKVNGSSIGMYDEYINDSSNTRSNIIFGKARSIRSDEWLVMTPYYFSQNYNEYDINSDMVGLSKQNMILGYNSPVYDITILAKPLVWGYIILGNDYGLSWYWISKSILMILFSFELFMILTKNNRKLSLLGALLISFGPPTLWWFAPHMPDVILCFMGMLVMSYHLITSEKKWLKNILTIILPFQMLEFVIALFPSFQVGLGWLYLVLMISLLIRDDNKFYKSKEKVFRILIVGVIALGLVGYFVYNNYDALKLTSSTVYPGERMEIGGNQGVKDLLTDLGTPFLSYKNSKLYTNSCEDSTYIHFGLFFLMLLPLIIKIKKKNKDKDYVVGLTIAVMMIIFASFMIVGFPTILSKITFFKYINRMKMIFGLVSVIFTIWSLNSLELVFKNKSNDSYYNLAVSSYGLLLLSSITNDLRLYIPIYIIIIEIALYILLLLSFRYINIKFGYMMILILLFFSSISINPIVVGNSSLTNHESAKKIKEIIENDKDSYWIGYNSLIYQGYLISNGAKTMNGVNFYPDIDKWKIIDEDNKYENNWNRYAHIIVNLTDKDNTVTNETSQDSINLSINSETLYKLNIKYILTNVTEDLSNFDSKEYKFNKIYQNDVVNIYQLVMN